MNQLVPMETKKARLQRVKDLPLKLAVAGTVTAMSVSSHAADTGLDMTPLTDGITAVTSNVKLLFAGALVVLALFVAWRYTKRGANSA